jgi:hypothetical protein
VALPAAASSPRPRSGPKWPGSDYCGLGGGGAVRPDPAGKKVRHRSGSRGRSARWPAGGERAGQGVDARERAAAGPSPGAGRPGPRPRPRRREGSDRAGVDGGRGRGRRGHTRGRRQRRREGSGSERSLPRRDSQRVATAARFPELNPSSKPQVRVASLESSHSCSPRLPLQKLHWGSRTAPPSRPPEARRERGGRQWGHGRAVWALG